MWDCESVWVSGVSCPWFTFPKPCPAAACGLQELQPIQFSFHDGAQCNIRGAPIHHIVSVFGLAEAR